MGGGEFSELLVYTLKTILMKLSLLIMIVVMSYSSIGQRTLEGTVITRDTIAKQKVIDSVVRFSNAEFDFGRIAFGKPVEYQLKMKNISKDTIRIENVQVTCGCTTPKWDANKRYAPGETFNITLGFNGNTKGVFQKTATIFFNGGLNKMVVFKGETYEVTPRPGNKR